jgi:peroxiredoxin
MIRFARLCVFIAAALFTSAVAAQSPLEVSKSKAKTVEVDRVGGAPVQPLDQPEGAIVVIVFGSVDCPVANAEVPEIRRIHERAKAGGASMFFVHPAVEQPIEKMAKHAQDRKLNMPVLHDKDRELVRLLGATTTPEAFVLRRDGDRWVVVYRGLIDNLYADVGRRRRNASTFYVRDAIDAAIARSPVQTPVRKPIGCLIERGVQP